jgi:hypothetical protein
MNLSPGDVLAMRYKVKRRIGGGSFGEIFIGKSMIEVMECSGGHAYVARSGNQDGK